MSLTVTQAVDQRTPARIQINDKLRVTGSLCNCAVAGRAVVRERTVRTSYVIEGRTLARL